MITGKFLVQSNQVERTSVDKGKLEIVIASKLEIPVNCQIELTDNRLILWITKEK